MGGPGLIGAIALGLAGGGLLWWYKAQQKPAPSPTGDACDAACKLAGQDNDICKGACRVGVGLIGIIPDPLHNTADQWDAELARRQTNNDNLNGDRDLELDALPQWTGNELLLGVPLVSSTSSGVKGGPVRYKNGCEPYYGAPGWSKCVAGTLDMYAMAIDAAAGTDRGFNEAHTSMFQPALEPSLVGGSRTVNLVKDNFGTGAVGDPTTQGPAVQDANTWLWLVRGEHVSGPAGKVPRAIAMQLMAGGGTQAQATAAIVALSDEQAMELIDPATAWANNTTKYDCTSIVASGLTWDPTTRSWRRMKAGEQQNLGPCAGASGGVVSKAATITSLTGTTFGFGILGL